MIAVLLVVGFQGELGVSPQEILQSQDQMTGFWVLEIGVGRILFDEKDRHLLVEHAERTVHGQPACQDPRKGEPGRKMEIF